MGEDSTQSEEVRIKAVLNENPLGMNIKEIAAALGMSRNSIAKYLDVLTVSGHLEVRQVGNAKMYYVSRRVPLGNIMSMSHELIAVIDRDLRIVRASDSFARFSGYPVDCISGMKLTRLTIPLVTGRDEPDLAALLRGGPALKKEVKVVKDGADFFFAARFIPTVFEDGGAGIALLLEDITEKRRAEAALRENERLLHTIFQISPVAHFLIDRNHKVVYWNRALEIMTKIKAEDVIGTKSHWRAFYAEQRPCLSDLLIDNDLAGIESMYSGRCRKMSPVDGAFECTDFFPDLGDSGRWLHFTAAVLRDASGNLVGAMETLEDVTDRRKGEFMIDTGF